VKRICSIASCQEDSTHRQGWKKGYRRDVAGMRRARRSGLEKFRRGAVNLEDNRHRVGSSEGDELDGVAPLLPSLHILGNRSNSRGQGTWRAPNTPEQKKASK